ncbi:MAG: hypothetical protein HKN22_07035, partial [Bacteroidia bacterium]|nr:hypothetical protein [Bacteroidia bacterium]
MFKDLLLAVRSFSDAHQLIIKNKFWIYLLIPGLINLILFLLSIKYFLDGSQFLTDWTLDLVGLDTKTEGFFGVLKEVLYWTLFV